MLATGLRALVRELTALAKDLKHYLGYYNFDRAHTARLPAEIVYGRLQDERNQMSNRRYIPGSVHLKPVTSRLA